MLAGSLFPNDADFPTINECRGVLEMDGSNPLSAVHRARGRVILLLHGVHDAAGPLAVSVRCLKLDPAIPRAVRPSIKVPSRPTVVSPIFSDHGIPLEMPGQATAQFAAVA